MSKRIQLEASNDSKQCLSYLKGSSIVFEGNMSDEVNGLDAAEVLEKVSGFKVWRCANDGFFTSTK